MITQETLLKLSGQWRIDEYSVLREYLQVLFLSTLSEHKESPAIYFKGGTALRLLLNSFRFSEDLDFTATLKAQTLLKVIRQIAQKIGLLAPGASVRKTKITKQAVLSELFYPPAGHKYPLIIDIEFSLREKPQTKKDTLLETLLPISPYPIVRHLDWPEILSEKVRALLTRGKGRDIFDVYYLMTKGVSLDWKLINKKMALFHQTADHNMLRQTIGRFETKTLERDLGKFLPETHRQIAGQLKTLLLEKLEK
ncbi:MAG: nucleotidyl transferase AbiEii/AbiGii toxin family protein [Elusimicrobia bacterium]|nr:nucleotidyl transferase AbiEii/AbiGii toxin family protein [Elusimicrobiota bacterium]